MAGAYQKKLIEARKAGATLAELREQMLEWHPNTQALADALAENVEAGLRGDSEEKVEASAGKTDSEDAGHEIGCNQYEDKPGCIQSSNTKKNKPKKSNKVGDVDKKAIFEVGSFPWLQDLGIKDGFVSVDGNIVREGIPRGRWTANNAARKINESLQNCKLSRQGFNHKKKNKKVVEAFCVLKTDKKTYYNKIVIDKESGKVVSFHDIGKNKFLKETEKASVVGKR